MPAATGIRIPVLLALAGAIVLGPGAPVRAEMVRPAELPPPDYAGQQYVDSKGCLFMRAGPPGSEMWLPRVTRDGVALCDNPPSGRRVPVLGDSAAVTEPAVLPAEGEGAATVPVPAEPAIAGEFFVAVESFADGEDAKTVLTRLRALGYPALQGHLAGESSSVLTVFAGPFSGQDEANLALWDLVSAGYPDAVLITP